MSAGCPQKPGTEGARGRGGEPPHETEGPDAGNSCDRNCKKRTAVESKRRRTDGAGLEEEQEQIRRGKLEHHKLTGG